MINKNFLKQAKRQIAFILCAFMLIGLCVALGLDVSAAQGSKYEGIKLIPGGMPFGVRFSTSGVMVVGFCDVDTSKGPMNPSYSAGLRSGDIITKINGKDLTSALELTDSIEKSGGADISVTYIRNGNEKSIKVTPLFSVAEQRYKAGIWVRDSGAGIGTVTYIMPKSYAFAGLGHGICDSETGSIIPMQRGTVTDVTISSIKKGIPGQPGEIKGYFGNDKLGTLIGNTECGVYGLFSDMPNESSESLPVASRYEVKTGEAYIYCTLTNGNRGKYIIEIQNINRDAKTSKCFSVKVKDEELIKKTGGIVQGMSGSPIIQNGKIVGAITHVLINDPTSGYGIFIENMLENMPDMLK